MVGLITWWILLIFMIVIAVGALYFLGDERDAGLTAIVYIGIIAYCVYEFVLT